jgi:ABC-type polysaccharide/polyol phosphate export permease
MLRKLAIITFGAIPASLLALIAVVCFLSVIYEDFRSGELSWNNAFGLPVCLACLAGTSGLWIVALNEVRIRRSKPVARVVCVMLLIGIAVAFVPLTLPAWWIRLLALSPILTAISVAPSIFRILKDQIRD